MHILCSITVLINLYSLSYNYKNTKFMDRKTLLRGAIMTFYESVIVFLFTNYVTISGVVKTMQEK